MLRDQPGADRVVGDVVDAHAVLEDHRELVPERVEGDAQRLVVPAATTKRGEQVVSSSESPVTRDEATEV